jgi:plastocyanin domain-containing protein
MDKIFITIGGILLIGATHWFFFGKNEEGTKTKKHDEHH